jgi:hypothetical protein
MTRYKDWIVQQDKDFIDEVCCGNKIPDKFKDYGYRDITLEELKILDAKFIANDPEGQET